MAFDDRRQGMDRMSRLGNMQSPGDARQRMGNMGYAPPNPGNLPPIMQNIMGQGGRPNLPYGWTIPNTFGGGGQNLPPTIPQIPQPPIGPGIGRGMGPGLGLNPMRRGPFGY